MAKEKIHSIKNPVRQNKKYYYDEHMKQMVPVHVKKAKRLPGQRKGYNV